MNFLQKIKKLLEIYGPIHYQLFSRDLNTLLICQALAKVLCVTTASNSQARTRLRTAFFGSHPLISYSECLKDFGFDISFFCGDKNNVFIKYDDAAKLNAQDFDCALVADEHNEEKLCALASSHGLSPIRIMRLVNAHISVLKKMHFRSVKTCLHPYKQAIITAAVGITNSSGTIVECGVFLGGTTVQIALLNRELGIDRKIFALDTYEGMPTPTDKDFGGGFVYTAGMFSENRHDLVQAYFRKAGVDQDITIIKGLCQETLPSILSKNPQVAFALLDTDQYAGTKGGLDCIAPTLSANAIIIVDDTSVHGVDVAIKESLRTVPGLARFPTLFNFDIIRLISPQQSRAKESHPGNNASGHRLENKIN